MSGRQAHQNTRHRDRERAFRRGQQDRLRNVSVASCPYADAAMAKEWECGWWYANAHAKCKKESVT